MNFFYISQSLIAESDGDSLILKLELSEESEGEIEEFMDTSRKAITTKTVYYSAS